MRELTKPLCAPSCLLLVVLLWLLPFSRSKAADMDVEVKAPPDWIAKPARAENESSRVSFKAPGDRDATLVVDQLARLEHGLPAGLSLEDFHVQWFKRMYGAEPGRENLTTFRSDHGEFWVSVFADPRLDGKPIVRDNYKYVVEITGLIDGKYLLTCGVLLQERQGKDLDEAKTAISLIKAK